MNLTSKFNLDFCKVRTVKTPAKAFDAAGIDFFVPEDLHFNDFAKNFGIYDNEWLIGGQKDADGYIEVPVDFRMANVEYDFEFTLRVKHAENKPDLWIGIKDSGDIFNPSDYLMNANTVITKMTLKPNAKILIPSGIKVKLPTNVALDATNKSGIASKRGLIVGAELIDPDYMGEVHINLINTNSDRSVVISAGDKIVQFLPMFIPNFCDVIEHPNTDELYAGTKSERGEGGFGSTGTK